jgi:hypothetical protein
MVWSYSAKAQRGHPASREVPRPPLCGAAPKPLLALPYRDVFPALTREGCSVPIGPSFAQPHPGDLSHEVKLGWPCVSKR